MLSDRRNIVVIADEAHRSQYDFIDGFAKHVRDGLPKASFIGFTGTPIESGDKNMQAVFGDYIDVYDILQSKEDKATLPIYYEVRLAKIDLKPEERPKIDPNFEEGASRTGIRRRGGNHEGKSAPEVGATGGDCRNGQTHRARGGRFGEALGSALRRDARQGDGDLTDDEVAFYDALEVNDRAVKVLVEPTLKNIARELVSHVRRSVTIDWTLRESAQAQVRVLVRRILRKHGYPPDKQETATQTVLEQAKLLCAEWAA